MFDYFKYHKNEFMNHYHKRSNVETTFHMLKIKFDKRLRSKSPLGQENEILAKCLCHNVCVLIQEAYEIGIDLKFEECQKIPLII
ncbi:transposase [Candidatus Woesearchaeota archaeon]|nr:transposase [Candidatus Woesearchaeota archaeon]